MEQLKNIYNTVMYFIYDKLYVTKIYPFILLGLIFGFIIFVGIKYSPARQFKNAYNSLNQRLMKSSNATALKNKKRFDFTKIHDTLLQNGILYRYPWMDNPATYLSVKIIFGLIVGFCLSQIWLLLIIPGFFLGYKGIDGLVYFINSCDNQKMQKDIELIYNLILIQSKSNVNLTYALCDCVDLVNQDDSRLIYNLKKLKINLYGGCSFKEAIQIFNESFNNQYIDSLCLTLIQVEETGLATNILKDINKQVQHFASLQLNKKKEEMDIKVTIASLLFLGAMLAIGIGAGFGGLVNSMSIIGLF